MAEVACCLQAPLGGCPTASTLGLPPACQAALRCLFKSQTVAHAHRTQVTLPTAAAGECVWHTPLRPTACLWAHKPPKAQFPQALFSAPAAGSLAPLLRTRPLYLVTW